MGTDTTHGPPQGHTDPDVPSLGSGITRMPLSYWRHQLTVNGWMCTAVAIAVATYAVLVDRPSVPLITQGILGIVIAWTVAWAPTDRLLLHGHGPPLFAGWSALTILWCATLVRTDGHLGLLTVFAAPIVFAQIAYPPRLAARVAVAAWAAALLTASTVTTGSLAGASGTLGMLLVIAVGGVAAARQHWTAAEHARHTIDALVEEAHIDQLTGCMAPGPFRTLVANLTDTDGVAVAMVDLDDFKAINDTHGHPHGDRVLADVGDALRRTVRAGDVVGRIGGDEFAVVLQGIHEPAQARAVAERLDRAVRTVGVTASIGIAVGATGRSGPRALGRADELMYAAKRSNTRILGIA
jgi:diguanylate cyclase (GGDEF)-like protein